MNPVSLASVRRLLVAVLVVASLGSSAVMAQGLLEEGGLAFDAATVGTVERSFTVTTAGAHDLTLRDLAAPAALNGVRAAIIRGATLLGTVELSNGAAGPAARRIDLAAGNYVVRVVGTPNPVSRAGSVAVEVVRASDSASVLQFNDAVSLAPPAIPDNTRVFETSFNVADASVHTVTLADLAFPQAAQSVSLLLTRGANVVGGPLAAPGSFTFSGQPQAAGDPPYTLRVILTAGPAPAGALAQVRVRNGGGAMVVDEAVTAGRVRLVGSSTLAAGAHTLRLTDLALPAALGAAQAIGVRDGVQVVRLTAAGEAAFNAAAGVHRLYALARPGSEPGSGAFAVEVQQGNAPVIAAAEAVNVGTPATPVFAYSVNIATAGSYSMRLSDFQFPNALAAVGAVATQGAAPLATLQSAGSGSLANVRSGPLFLLAAARAGGTTGGSLFGLELLPAAGGNAVFDVTQGVGAVFRTRRFDVATAGRYDVTVRDLAFPANFIELFAVVTRGPNRVGSIFTGGTFSFDATAGSYFMNFIARPDLAQGAGSYAISVAASPPAPTVTLTAGAASVVTGGTVTLTWSSQNATSCTASGGWSGSRPTSGSESSAAINSATTYTLTCNGGGGSASASATVNVTSPPAGGGSGGGGAFDVWLLSALLTLLAFARLGRARGRQVPDTM